MSGTGVPQNQQQSAVGASPVRLTTSPEPGSAMWRPVSHSGQSNFPTPGIVGHGAAVDVVIPTVEGREDSLARCIASYEENTAPGVLDFIVVHDEPTCGLAWIKGMEESKAPYVHLTADDIEMASPTWAGVCMETTDAGELPCPIVRRPGGSIESCGGDMNRPACLISELQPDRSPVDFTVLPFFSREQANAIGMVAGHYMTDVYASHRGRQLGYETVVRHGYELVHHRSNVKRLDVSAGDHHLYNKALA